MNKTAVGAFIAEQRKQRSLTQKQFADMLGVTDKAVSRWETGKGYPDTETLEKISEVFEVSISDILSGEITVPEKKVEAADKNLIDAMELNKKATKKWKTAFVCIIILAVFLAVSLWKILDLSDYLSVVEQNHAYEMENMRQQIDSIYNNVDEQMKKDASLLSYTDCRYGELNSKNHTVKMTFTVVPKTITEETKISLKIGNDTVEFKKQGDKFVAEYDAYAFKTDSDENEFPLLTITNGEEAKTEYLENIDTKYIYNKYLGIFTDGASNISSTLNRNEFHIDANFSTLYIKPDDESDHRKMYIITEFNGEILERKDVTYAVDEHGFYNESMRFNYTVDMDDEVSAYAVLEDEYGYYHCICLYQFTFDSSGPNNFFEQIDDTEKIYDQNGKLLIQ